jgi:hypothetical protein
MAIDLTGISNVNEFYSHHYLDSLLEGDLKGLYKKWQDTDVRSPYEKLSGIAQKYFRAKSDAFNEIKPEDRSSVTSEFHTNLINALGYEVEQQLKFTEDRLALPIFSAVKRDGNEYLWIIETVFWTDDVSIFEQPLVLNNQNDEVNWFEDSIDTAIQEIFRIEEPPRWVLLLAGQKLYLLDRNKWGHGKYLLFDLDELFGRKQTETLKAAAALLTKDALSPEEGVILHDELDENSHKHAFSVSEDLKYGVRRAVELIGNEFIHYRSKVAKRKIYGDEELASKLTKECLNYLYRLLFLFYAESRSEQLNVVPMKSEEYRLGYSLETLRELELVPLTTEASREGYFIHESLNTLFNIVNEGFGNQEQFEVDYESGNYVDEGFVIDGLQSPLFEIKQTPLLSSVKFRNYILQEVIQLLSLSKEGSKQRGRISYAQLGINQLGAVYEGLLSYSGFFAQETLYEVKPASINSTDETGQSYFIPESDINQYKEDEFVLYKEDDDINRRKKYEKGSFIFRLAGRDREKSASYYTPEVLTHSLVKYSLKELLIDKTADDILNFTICEPAMGSGAFLNEAINQLADAYLERKQKELKITINPESYSHEKQRVKSYLATNNIYGVDLNPTAVELAKVSLWLNTIYEGSKTPWFSARMGVGNSLIGARRLAFNAEDLTSGKWHNKVPTDVNSGEHDIQQKVYHFLIPDRAMVAFEGDKIITELASKEIDYIKQWRLAFTRKFDTKEVESLIDITRRIDNLWTRLVNNRKRLLKSQREQINLWGQATLSEERRISSIKLKDEELALIKESPTSAYRALKLIMDYWCSLWFWPLHKVDILPTRDEFILDIAVILDAAEGFGPDVETLIKSIERLEVVQNSQLKHPFVHWELEFPEVFIDRGGFDLVVGNPPWIKLGWEEKGILSESLPLINLRKMTATKVMQIRKDILEDNKNKIAYFNEFIQVQGQASFLKSYLYNNLQGVQLNLYKSFFLLSNMLCQKEGIYSILHLEGIFDDPRGGKLRKFLYPKLRWHFQYINELKLFAEVHHLTKFGCSILSPMNRKSINFKCLFNLFHPKTIDESLQTCSDIEVPGIKGANNQWEVRGHQNRIINFDKEILEVTNKLYIGDSNYSETPLITIHSKEIVRVLKKMSMYNVNLNLYKDDVYDTEMFHETNDQKKNNIERETHHPTNINDFVYSGPHFFVGTPFYKSPNENCKHNLDYSKIDLSDIKRDYIPRTNYKINSENSIGKWNQRLVTTFDRQIFRKMLSPTGERTLIGCLMPKGASHINGCISYSFKDSNLLLLFSGVAASIVHDFFIKSTGRSNLSKIVFNLPIPKKDSPINFLIISRTLRLNCLTEHFSEMWENHYQDKFRFDSFSKKDSRLSEWSSLSKKWDENVPLRNDFERRQALIELDVLSALVIGLSLDELLTIYKVQFPVLNSYENETFYDQEGKIVFTINRGLPEVGVKRTEWNHIKDSKNIEELPLDLQSKYVPPFIKCDRSSDLTEAYEHFSRLLQNAKGEVNV